MTDLRPTITKTVLGVRWRIVNSRRCIALCGKSRGLYFTMRTPWSQLIFKTIRNQWDESVVVSNTLPENMILRTNQSVFCVPTQFTKYRDVKQATALVSLYGISMDKLFSWYNRKYQTGSYTGNGSYSNRRSCGTFHTELVLHLNGDVQFLWRP